MTDKVFFDYDQAALDRQYNQRAWVALIARLGDEARYDRFEVMRLKRWSAGKVALIGDAAHAVPPNLGQRRRVAACRPTGTAA